MSVVDALPGSLVSIIERGGLPAAELEALLRVPEGASIILAGSQAEGVATKVSDIDLLVLLEDAESFVPDAAGWNMTVFPAQSLTRYLILLDRLELDLEVVHKRNLAPLMPGIEALEMFRGSGGTDGVLQLPTLQAADARLLTRIARGEVLQGAERAQRWRAELKVGLLPAFWVTANFVSAMALIEDAVTLDDHASPGTVKVGRSDLAARSAADNLLLASLAALGEVRWDLKALPRLVSRLSASRSLPRALAAPMELAFPSHEIIAVGQYPAVVFDFAKDLFSYIRELPELGGAVDFLRRFGTGRWELDTAFMYG
jgi:hypothetical protein